jgi:hypothetical protein
MPSDPNPTNAAVELAELHAIRQTWMRRWWLFTLGLWLTVGLVSIWQLHRTWTQLAKHFTWAALRYGLAFNREAAVGLGLCLGLTVALLLKESRFLLFGLTERDYNQLLKALRQRK